MTETQFQTFLTGGLFILVVAALAIAWLLWRAHEDKERCTNSALEGVGHEFALCLHRMIAEISALSQGQPARANSLMPSEHPQLDAVNAAFADIDRKALARVTDSYYSLNDARMELRSTLINDGDVHNALNAAQGTMIDGIIALYLWENHRGCMPDQARSTRTWAVRDWMKAHQFKVDAFPGLHLRDAVVERLRQRGMHLTPRPLTLTAHEYWSKRYDRQKDPRGVFGARKIKPEADSPPPEVEVHPKPALPAPQEGETSERVSA